ncbi:MAG: protein kinase, partial [Thermoanaerobaculia bacterium]
MPENILVVEYEPRYSDRVKQALLNLPLIPSFVGDGEEALKVLETLTPRLIVLSSVVAKVSAPDLIREIRSRSHLAQTPILLTVSGYDGKDAPQDAVRFGVSDILSKPYSEEEFVAKVQRILGLPPSAPSLEPRSDLIARTAPFVAATEGQLTSNEIFGELLDREPPATEAAPRRAMNPKDDVDKMLAETLGGMMPQKKKDAAPATSLPASLVPPAPAAAPAVTPPAPRVEGHSRTSAELDRMLQDTLSGLSTRKTTSGGNVAVPAVPSAPPTDRPAPAAVPAPSTPGRSASEVDNARVPAVVPERMSIAQPVLAPTAAAAPLEEDEPVDGIKFGQYVLLEKIATGGMAEVWKARMRGVEGFQKIVAIKKILPHLSDNQDFIEMFIDEAKFAAQLNHNNIIHIYDLGKIQSSYYIAMEYVDGSDLKTILKRSEERNHPVSPELAVFIASKIASALDYAHRKRDFEDQEIGLVHRDVSPQNVLISEEGDIKLCDFGIAKAASKASHTQAGALKGKLQYMS